MALGINHEIQADEAFCFVGTHGAINGVQLCPITPRAPLEQATYSPPSHHAESSHPYVSHPHPSPLRISIVQPLHTGYRLTCAAEESLTRPQVIRTDPSASPSRVFASTKSAQCSLVSSSSRLASKGCDPHCVARGKVMVCDAV